MEEIERNIIQSLTEMPFEFEIQRESAPGLIVNLYNTSPNLNKSSRPPSDVLVAAMSDGKVRRALSIDECKTAADEMNATIEKTKDILRKGIYVFGVYVVMTSIDLQDDETGTLFSRYALMIAVRSFWRNVWLDTHVDGIENIPLDGKRLYMEAYKMVISTRGMDKMCPSTEEDKTAQLIIKKIRIEILPYFCGFHAMPHGRM
jgi:hypothetical protein